MIPPPNPMTARPHLSVAFYCHKETGLTGDPHGNMDCKTVEQRACNNDNRANVNRDSTTVFIGQDVTQKGSRDTGYEQRSRVKPQTVAGGVIKISVDKFEAARAYEEHCTVARRASPAFQ